MKLTPPTKIVFWIATALAALSLISTFATKLPIVSGNEYLVAIAAFVLLWLGNAMKGF